MKKTTITLLVLTLMLAGCGTSDLVSYREAVALTKSYDKGVSNISQTLNLTFNEEGLSEEAIRDLSYYEKIDIAMTTRYNTEGNDSVVTSDIYYNLGGLGFDMTYYLNRDEFLMKIPILDKYVRREDLTGKETPNVSSNNLQAEAIQTMVERWNEVLGEEDVLSGSKAYVMTDKGQLKTTTYTITIDDAQFRGLKNAFLDVLADPATAKAFLANGEPFIKGEMNVEEIQGHITDLVTKLTLESFEGKAYVDFDGRLVRQVFDAKLRNTTTAPGEVATMTLRYEIDFDQLGTASPIQWPTISDEEMLELKEGETINDLLPEGLF